MLVKNFSEFDFLEKYNVYRNNLRILNAGSSQVSYGENCVNVDIQNKPNVDVVCDIRSLPASLGKFDVVMCNAVLQYCEQPSTVARQFFEVLEEGGYLYVDAPWVQPYCPDTADKFRFSEDGLKAIFSDFEIIESGATIRPGSAFAFLGVKIAEELTSNRYMNFMAARIAAVLLFPFRWIRTSDENKTAGAFYLVCRKPLAGGKRRREPGPPDARTK